MSRINRIRIANVSYDGKHINDQIFNLYEGKNVLFNLANGSGKSVLVQMMLQPVLPCIKINNRKVAGYLSKAGAGRPTYIMVEWILDTNAKLPSYFLTGIVMCSVGQGSEDDLSLKYFTFTHKYEKSTQYDIVNTPIVERTGERVDYMSYSEAQKLLQTDGERKGVTYFSADSKIDYHKHLYSHGIFTKEWKLIARVNDGKEGGISDLFKECKSSDALLDKWILRTIAENYGDEGKNLHDMFFDLFNSIIKQDDKIVEKEILTDFIVNAGEISEKLTLLCGALKERDYAESLLIGLHGFLENKIKASETEMNEFKTEAERQKAEEHRIDYEEISEKWHNLAEIFLTQEKLLKESTEKEHVLTEELRNAKYKREVMEAAEHFEEKVTAEGNIAANREMLEALKNSTAESQANNVIFTLDRVYENEIKTAEENLISSAKRENELKEILNKSEAEKKQLENEKSEKDKKSGALNTAIETFKNYEDEYLEEYEIRRNFAGELVPEEVEERKNELLCRVDNLKENYAILVHKKEENKNLKEALNKESKELHENEKELSLHVQEKKAEINVCENEVKNLQAIAERRGLSKAIEDIQNNIHKLSALKTSTKEELGRCNTLLLAREEKLKLFNENRLHNSREFAFLLEEKEISFLTGENYLKERNADEQSQLLALNPMLPYCFLVGEGDFEKVVSLQCNDGIDRIVPVITFESVDNDLGGRHFSYEKNSVALCHYIEKSFNPATKDKFGQMLESEICFAKEQSDKLQKEFDNLRDEHNFFENFPYTAEKIKTLQTQLDKLLLEENELTNKIEKIEREKENIEKSSEELLNEIEKNLREQSPAENNLREFLEYLEKDAIFCKNVQLYRKVSEELIAIEKRVEEISFQINKIQTDSEAVRNEIKRLNGEKSEIEGKKQKLPITTSGNFFDWSLTALEDFYKDFLQNQTREQADIIAKIEAEQKRLENANQRLKKYEHLPAEEIEKTKYNPDHAQFLRQSEKEGEEGLSRHNEEQKRIIMEHAKAVSDFDHCKSDLQKTGCDEPLPASEIKRDYINRRAIIKETLSRIEKKLSELRNRIDKYKESMSHILRAVDLRHGDSFPEPENGWESVDISAQAANIKRLGKDIEKSRRNAETATFEIKEKFAEKHTVITRMLKSFDIENCAETYAAYSYVLNRFCEQISIIEKCLYVISADLERLDNEKANIVHQAFLHGSDIFKQIKKISELSRINNISGKARMQTVKISIPDELDSTAKERVGNHVEAVIADLRKRAKEPGFEEKNLRDVISKRMSDRELLNQTIGGRPINVSLLKIDEMESNTRLRTWESVIEGNSGGEMFVSCFFLLSTLMEYSRERMPGYHDTNSTGSKVMLIDNPFAATSSTHLLDALVTAAKRFGLQMLCLSDLSQSSITSKFDLIYQLSLRPTLDGSKLVLKQDNFIANTALETNSRLEHVYFRHEQMIID